MDVLADSVRCRIVCMRLKKSKKKKFRVKNITQISFA